MTTSAAVTKVDWGDAIGTGQKRTAGSFTPNVFGLHGRNGANGIDGARTNSRRSEGGRASAYALRLRSSADRGHFPA